MDDHMQRKLHRNLRRGEVNDVASGIGRFGLGDGGAGRKNERQTFENSDIGAVVARRGVGGMTRHVKKVTRKSDSVRAIGDPLWFESSDSDDAVRCLPCLSIRNRLADAGEIRGDDAQFPRQYIGEFHGATNGDTPVRRRLMLEVRTHGSQAHLSTKERHPSRNMFHFLAGNFTCGSGELAVSILYIIVENNCLS
jgi:hypothetical protein